jgi:hypothetical protein
MKTKTPHEYDEGAAANRRFESAMKTILSVSRDEMKQREKRYQDQQALKPKRGPKPKASVSRARGSDS